MRILRIEVETVCILAYGAALQVVAYFVVYCWCILIRMRILRIEVENVCILAYSAALSWGEPVLGSGLLVANVTPLGLPKRAFEHPAELPAAPRRIRHASRGS